MSKITIRAARANANISGNEMAKRLNMSIARYYRIENYRNKHSFRIEEATKFVNICGVHLDDVIFFKNNNTSSVASDDKEES
ncbi:helix-turn-helix domain-containing protein [Limosilactobacillus fermentum]|uniref:helix-turn-helix domain-containing protein n=1 Tax=Limosilactobacillus fermentum TaxID=1613 RepID=UPI0015EB6DB6|nr:helix-turn-helix transcriptional regulator [Limosilactobacillus fermentum]